VNPTPPVSVLMTVRNGERYIVEAIESALNQAITPAEIVVVDDGSTDATAELVRGFGSPVALVQQPPTGMAAGLNRALRHSSCPVVGYLDADDLWCPDALPLRLERLDAADQPDAAGGLTQQFLSPDLTPEQAARFRLTDTTLQAGTRGALLFRRERLEAFGPIDEGPVLASTIDWMARARLGGLTVGWVDHVVLRRRIHLQNLSIQAHFAEYQAMLEVVRRQHHRRTRGQSQ
jgi:glycosyltransferase involved in cell wall biosynthesis